MIEQLNIINKLEETTYKNYSLKEGMKTKVKIPIKYKVKI